MTTTTLGGASMEESSEKATRSTVWKITPTGIIKRINHVIVSKFKLIQLQED